MKFIVPSDRAVACRRDKGITVTFVNQGAQDVYFDSDPGRLNASVEGGTPEGTKLSAGGGQLQVSDFPGQVWFRSAISTTIEVQP